ncbi:MAG: HIT family protein [Planctomycetota bacterium]
MADDVTHLFEKIAAGEIPSHKVYEDDHVFAFLDINPVSRGHTLVIPKQRYERLDDLPEELSAAIGRVLPRLASAVCKASGAHSFNVLSNTGKEAGQVIPHVHFHIIPWHGPDRSLGITWPARPVDEADAKELCQRISTAVASDG